ncbi:MAG TPA: tetratricopeptide repeat protein [Polyangia bacterium]|jgi:tetratricopeptide (TPR) repeat protein
MRRLAVALVLVLAGSATARADWEVKRSPFDARLVGRYKQILHGNPDDGEALARLTALYKQYKSVAVLERELSGVAEKSHEVNDWLAVGNLLRDRGDFAGAAKAYAAALEANDQDARALAALADADARLGKNGEARPLYERALGATSDGKKKRPLLKKLIDLALAPDRGLDAKAALAEARKYHDELVRLDPRDEDAKREWAEALAAHGQPGEAAVEWRALAATMARDPAQQGQAWLRAGELAEAANDDAEARKSYDKTFALAPKGNYLRREAADKIVGLARKHDTLRMLTGEWERAWPDGGRDFSEWELLGRLYDELGDAEKAQADFKRALAIDPQALDARRRLIALYERTGRDAEALAELKRLIASAPGEARFRLELAERLMKAGNRDEALKIAQALGRESTDPALHAQLAELYTRWNLADPAMREQELLVRLEPGDDAHLVALGELWWQKGNKKRAVELWRKLLERGPKVPAMARLAEVFVEHDMAPEALDLFEKASKLAPDDVTVQKGLGTTLERLHRDGEALDVWTTLFARAAEKHDRPAQLEARQRLLVIAQRTGRLGSIVEEYREEAQRERKHDEEEAAAYTLIAADALVKMGRMEMAEELLRGLADSARSRALRADAWLGLAQVDRARHRLGDALAALKKAAELAPERGHELYPQIAELSLQLYQDADALSYAKRAVQLGPADAAATVRLGEVLEKREDLDGAAQAYERALELDDRQWKVYFTLARLRIRIGQEARAAELYRTVMRRAPDEEMVIDAARRAIDLEEYLGSLGELERELSPLAYAHADKPVYRNLLIELYDRYGTPLAARAIAPGNDDGESVRLELKRLGEHGLRPLLDVLVDGEAHEMRVAVALLGAIGNPSAAPALFRLALDRHVAAVPSIGVGHDDRASRVELRELAALAAAEVATARELPMLQKLAADPEKQLRVAAAYGLGRLADKRAQAALTSALDDGAADVQAMACMALGAHADGRALDAMIAHLKPAEARRPETRIGCAFGLGAAALRAQAPLSTTQRASVRAALAATLGEGADEVQHAAAWALGAVGGDEARPPLLRAVFVKRDDIRRTATLALSRRSLLARALPPPARGDDGLDVRATLASLATLAATPAPGEAAPAPIDSAGDLAAVADALDDALARHRDIILRALDDLAAAGSESEAALWPRVAPSVRALATHADAAVRARVARLAARNDDADLLAAMLTDKARPVRLAALDAVAAAPPLPRPSRAQLAAEVEHALHAADWLERRAAALAAGAHPELWTDKGARALAPLRHDPSGFVRQAVR